MRWTWTRNKKLTKTKQHKLSFWNYTYYSSLLKLDLEYKSNQHQSLFFFGKIITWRLTVVVRYVKKLVEVEAPSMP